MQQIFPEIVSNEKIAENVYEMKLRGDFSAIKGAGQFVNLTVDGCYLRRPISVCDAENGVLTLVFKVVGKGTEIMSRMQAGKTVDMLVGLGNGYNLEKSGSRPLLVGGGVGVPPLYKLCKELIKRGVFPVVVLGFNKASEVFYKEKFEALGAETYLATADGSLGEKGFVTDVIARLDYTYFYACGPMPMFRALESIAKTDGEYSFEERMGCGFGACMGCSVLTKNGAKRICKDGPVLQRSEIIW